VALESSLDLREAVASLLRDGASHRAAQRYAAARAALARPRKILTAILETVIRTPLLRSRASVAVRRSAKAAETILAAVSGAANPLGLPSLRALAALFV
jgi:hypothetical protein